MIYRNLMVKAGAKTITVLMLRKPEAGLFHLVWTLLW